MALVCILERELPVLSLNNASVIVIIILMHTKLLTIAS